MCTPLLLPYRLSSGETESDTRLKTWHAPHKGILNIVYNWGVRFLLGLMFHHVLGLQYIFLKKKKVKKEAVDLYLEKSSLQKSLLHYHVGKKLLVLKVDQNGRQPNRERGKRSEETIHKRAYPNGKEAYEKVLTFISHQEIQLKTTM